MMLPVYKISNLDLQIVDSYKISKHDFGSVLTGIEEKDSDYLVWDRSKCGMKLEWATHNWCYRHGIKPESTVSVDLEYPQPWYMTLAYCIVGSLVWLFIK